MALFGRVVPHDRSIRSTGHTPDPQRADENRFHGISGQRRGRYIVEPKLASAIASPPVPRTSKSMTCEEALAPGKRLSRQACHWQKSWPCQPANNADYARMNLDPFCESVNKAAAAIEAAANSSAHKPEAEKKGRANRGKK
jgi:hypothetical protein